MNQFIEEDAAFQNNSKGSIDDDYNGIEENI